LILGTAPPRVARLSACGYILHSFFGEDTVGTLLKLAAIATIGGLFIAILAQLVEFPKLRFPGEDPGSKGAAPLQEAHSPAEVAPPGRVQTVDLDEPVAGRVEAPLQQVQANPEANFRSTGTSKSPREAVDSTLPIEFTLEDGEQKVLLGGRAAVAVEFARAGAMEFTTLRIHTDGSTRNEALLGPGGRFELTAGGDTYLLSVLSLDSTAGRVKLSIDPKPP
jgi:hypothetical protein